MGTWDAGNFDSDDALLFAGELMKQLRSKVFEWFDSDDPDITAGGEAEVIPAIAVMSMLAEQSGTAPPRPLEIQDWRNRYLAIFDEQIDSTGADPDFIKARRTTISDTLAKFEMNASRFWSSSSTNELVEEDEHDDDEDDELQDRAFMAKSALNYHDDDDDDEFSDDDKEETQNDAVSAPASSTFRRFEYSDDKSEKFWEIKLDGTSFSVKFGRIGTAGQMQTKTFSSTNTAKYEYEKLVSEKMAKGYEEV